MTTREKVTALAKNLWWSWNPEVLDLFQRLNPERFRAAGNNPVASLADPDAAVLEDSRFMEDVDEAYQAFQGYMDRAPRYEDAPRVSYFCMEFGLHESLPLYSGGLGILAGDHAKAASDLGLPFTAIGLFLREGYFRQHFDKSGWQQADFPQLDPEVHPLTLVRNEEGEVLTVTVHLEDQPLVLQAWRVELGRTTLYLLDSDLEVNPPELRSVTRRLYQGGPERRLQQEIVLGIGGMRLLRALGVETDVYHMNEGHCAFLTLELLREHVEAGAAPEAAAEWVRDQCVFTTHTPVIAGHDRFRPDLVTTQMRYFLEQSHLSDAEFMGYGRVNPGNADEPFCMTVLGLKMARKANGVSRLNGQVVREQWQMMYPEASSAEVPIGHVTNGIHLPTWTTPHARAMINARFGDWLSNRDDPAFWEQVDRLTDEQLWQYRSTLRGILLDFVRKHVERQSLPQKFNLDPDALTIGFARRFATYKRAPLLFQDTERAIRLFSQADRPLQVIYAGKAHPEDEGGKQFIQRIYEMSQHPAIDGRVVFLENYDMEIGRQLVSGCDVWLNNPRRPMEASGTSGQKITVHGGLNFSVLDGWWPEGYNGENGWTIGEAFTAPAEGHNEDAEDALALYDTLENEILPAFYDRDEQGVPHAWVARMREAIRTLPARFSAARMVSDYVEQMYRQVDAQAVEG